MIESKRRLMIARIIVSGVCDDFDLVDYACMPDRLINAMYKMMILCMKVNGRKIPRDWLVV